METAQEQIVGHSSVPAIHAPDGAEDDVTLTVLRPFIFSYPGSVRHRITREQRFVPRQNPATKEWIPTEMRFPREVAEHPFICEHFADGCIEPPTKTRARLQAAAEKVQREAEDGARQLSLAEAALARATGSAKTRQASEESLNRELNSPVNQLGAEQGRDIDKAALDEQLNTPVNELAAGRAKKK